MSDKHEHGHEHAHEHFHEHTHIDEAGHEYSHTHIHGDVSHQHDHGHVHSADHTKAVLNRMSRIIGHMESTKRMVEEATALGADAVVNIRYASAAVMQGAAEVIVYGTAVKFVK
jgi:DNA-binding FrmR family transcriptional regulator